MNKKQWGMMTLGIVSLVLAGCGSTTDTSDETTTLAQCLTQKGAIMYGTNRCPHCQNQKKLFGESFSHVNFVDCDKEKTVCQLAGIQGYPTWKFTDGTVLHGTQSLEALAQAAHCGQDTKQEITEQTADSETLSGNSMLESGEMSDNQTGDSLSGEALTGEDALADVVVTPTTGSVGTGA